MGRTLRAAVSVTLAHQKASSLANERCVTHNNMGSVKLKGVKPKGSQAGLILVASEGPHHTMAALIGALFLVIFQSFPAACIYTVVFCFFP